MKFLRPASAALGLALTLTSTCLAQFVPAPDDLIHKKGYADITVRYKEVPSGICESVEGVKSYSGYADVGQDEHLFFWFFETRHGDPKDADLSIWVNGGPGSSSMIGLFQEHGPCGYKDGETYFNPHSWNNVSNMLYIDQPVGVGFSYARAVPGYTNPNYGSNTVVLPSEECTDYAEPYGTCGTYSLPDVTTTANTTQGAAPNFWKAIQGFMGAFPQYSRNEIHFTSESYGGHYAPVFSEYFLEQNAKNIQGAHKIVLKSVTINNGWYDPAIQYQAYYNYTVSPGNTFDYSPFNETTQDELYNNLYGPGNCVDQIKQCALTGRNDVCSIADNFCANYVENVFDVVTGRDEYDVRELEPDPFPYSDYIAYLNTPKVQEAIGAYVNYTESSNLVGSAYGTTGDDGRESLTIEKIRLLLRSNITVTLWAGDADYNCNWLGGEAVASEINHHGYSTAGYTNIKTSDGVTHGQTKQSGLFSFSRIYESGHEVPFYQPLAALEVFHRSITGRDIATGKTVISKGYTTKGSKQSTYMEGNSTISPDVLPSNATYSTTTGAPSRSQRRRKSVKFRPQ
ncbi:hypothetical protein CBS101457_004798 [Exobasidium rhododendri]|nr:hypothetical protein CBS101457_004798 [Exobasidium rhododendri]